MTSESPTAAPRGAALLLLAAAAAGCTVVEQEAGISVSVTVDATDLPAPEGPALDAAWVGIRSVELLPCAVAWHPLDLLGGPARADHPVDAPTAAAFPGPVDLLSGGTTVRIAPPPDEHCTVRFVLEPLGDETKAHTASVGAATAAGETLTDRVAWLDLPLALTVDEDHPTAALRLSFALADWPAAAAAGPDALFETARSAVALTLD